jgi:hypothetical protein
MLASLTLESYAYAVTFLAGAVLLAIHLDPLLRLIWFAGADAPSETGAFRLGNGDPAPLTLIRVVLAELRAANPEISVDDTRSQRNIGQDRPSALLPPRSDNAPAARPCSPRSLSP